MSSSQGTEQRLQRARAWVTWLCVGGLVVACGDGSSEPEAENGSDTAPDGSPIDDGTNARTVEVHERKDFLGEPGQHADSEAKGPQNVEEGTRAVVPYSSGPQVIPVNKVFTVLRVSTNDAQVPVNASQIYDYVLSTKDDSARTQFDQCSGGEVKVSGQVFEVKLDVKVGNYRSSQLRDLALQKASQIPGFPTQSDHLLFCVPSGTINSFVSVGDGGGNGTTYSGPYCGGLTMVMHEVGHNLRLSHASSSEGTYNDSTGYMGYASTSRLRMCFNGANHWKLGWFGSRRGEVVPSTTPSLVTLAAFTDHAWTSSSQPVLLRVGDLYLQYNRAEGPNINTRLMRDQVTVVRDTGGNTMLLAGLDEASPPFEVTLATGKLIIDVCKRTIGQASTPDAMQVSVGLGRSACP